MDKRYILLISIFLIILIVSLLIYKARDLERTYETEVMKEIESTAYSSQGILTQEDIQHLPEPVQKYLIYVGALGKEKVNNVKVVFDGDMKTDRQKDWMAIRCEQYNFFDEPNRQFFIKANMFGLPVIGLHSYVEGNATMRIKVAGLIAVVDGKGPEMNHGETVTVFNDMCFLAPASLIDKRIHWETIDSQTVRATFVNKGNKISAVLYFNDQGELINFVSDDRYYSPTGDTYQKARWSTPLYEYKEFNGRKVPTYGEAIWHLPEGDYCYIKINIKSVEYNKKSFQ